MSSTRLTNELRNRICKAVLAHRFASEEATLEKAKAALTEMVYATLYPPERAARFEGASEGEYAKLDFIDASFGGLHAERLHLPENRPFFAKHNSYRHTIRFAADEPATQAWEKLQVAKGKFHEAKETAAAKVNGILSEATTVEKLLKIWPEVEPFIPPTVAPVHLPAVPRAEVNALLGLPAKKEE